MVNQITNEATEFNNNYSDTQMGGTGIGQSSANIDLDAANKPDPKPQKESKPEPKENDIIEEIFNQGEHEQKIYDTQYELENLLKEYEKIKNGKESNIWDNLSKEQYDSIIQKYDPKPSYITLPNGQRILMPNTGKGSITERDQKNQKHNIERAKKLAEENLQKQIGAVRNTLNNLKSDSNYDNRSDEQKREDNIRENLQDREDNAYERAVNDMRKAGINPAALYGGAAGAGGGGLGGGGSSKEEEEERKRRKKKEEEERRKREQEKLRQQQLMQVLGMIGGAGSLIGMQSMRNRGAVAAARVQRTYTRMDESRAKKELRDLLNSYD